MATQQQRIRCVPKSGRWVPPHWNLYISVDSADNTAKRAGELGGKIIAAPFDVMTFGRMAVIQDPTGAVFCVWQPGSNPGSTVKGESGTVCWADLSTPDPSRAKPFYESLLGWKIGPVEPYPPDYLVIKNGEEPIGGVTPVAYRNANVPPHSKFFSYRSQALFPTLLTASPI
jgi:predicted enzyme related to lactoylglutathione lyase